MLLVATKMQAVTITIIRCKCRIGTTSQVVNKIIRSPYRTDRETCKGSLSLMRCNCRIENSTCRIVQKILYSPNRTNRSNRQTSTRVPEYRGIFRSVANEMQMSNRKLYLSDHPKNTLFAKERIGQIRLLFFPIKSSSKYWTTLRSSCKEWTKSFHVIRQKKEDKKLEFENYMSFDRRQKIAPWSVPHVQNDFFFSPSTN